MLKHYVKANISLYGDESGEKVKFHIEELHNLYNSQCVRGIKPIVHRWAGQWAVFKKGTLPSANKDLRNEA